MRWRLVVPLMLAAASVPAEAAAPEPVPVQVVLEDVPLALGFEVPVTPQHQVLVALAEQGRADEFLCLSGIFQRESGWNPDARGDGGDSFGLPQRHAPSWGVPPDPWPVPDQVAWSLAYADGRYGGVCEAWVAWQERASRRGGAGWW